MVMICFVLDLRSLSPPLLREFKQSLLQLANFYSISACNGDEPRSQSLSDRIGLCYILTNRQSYSDELKVAYAPSGSFNLRKFHHAVDSLPMNAFLPEINDSGALSASDMKFATILSSEYLYTWGGHEKDIAKKVILVSSCVIEDLDLVKKDILMDAADRCVSIEFLLLEQEAGHLGNLSENISNFVKQISDLENCSFHAFLPDPQVLCSLVKRWVQELKDDMDEPLQARLFFKSKIFGSLDLVLCTLFASSSLLIDGFSACQYTCRCHGFPSNDSMEDKIKQASFCSVTGNELETFNLVENSLKVGEQTNLLLPSFKDCVNLQKHVSRPIDLNVVERTSLGTLSEAVLVGTSFLVTPSAFCDSDEVDKSELNTQLFQGLCTALHSLDEGLVCSSKCNIETKRESLFHCYYILLPSEKGLMLLRRLAGSEEALPFPDVSQLMSCSATSEIENSIKASLLKMEVRDYNPFLHVRGFHQKLNSLVKECLQIGLINSDSNDVSYQTYPFEHIFSDDSAPPVPNPEVVIIEEEIPQREVTEERDHIPNSITEEWEQLIVCEGPKMKSPTFVPKTKSDQLVLSSQDSSRKIDEKTSRILERLEVPKQLKRKSPIVKSAVAGNPDSYVPSKLPLIPFRPTNGEYQDHSSSQPLKPNFQRHKRKHK